MNLRSCPRQAEVRQLLARGQWPHACSPDLRAHLTACRSCTEHLIITQAFQRARATTAAQAQLPAPGAIWWRAQLRRRNTAIQRVGRPIMGAYLFALSITVLVATVLAIGQAHRGMRWLDWLQQPSSAALHLQSLNPLVLLNSNWTIAVLIPVLATGALLGAVAVYLAADRS